MCGIAGIVRAEQLRPDDRAKIEKMADLLHSRGPDGKGIYLDARCALAQTRLALVDSEPHLLPVSMNSGRYQIVFNGEIYNHASLRRELARRFDFQTRTDTEVLLAAWIEWGPQALQRIDGMYAFFIWDSAKGEGFGARDPLGVKPFFYGCEDGDFIFASEPRAMVRSGSVRFAVDEFAIAETLTAPFFSGATRTPFSGISILEPGSWLYLTHGRLQIRSSCKFIFQPDENFEGQGGLDELERAFGESVRSMSRGEVEVGVFLSGGLDSSLISSYVEPFRGRPVKAWTVHYPENDEIGYRDSLIVKSSDLPNARLAARELKLDGREVIVNPPEFTQALRLTTAQNDLISVWEQEISQNRLAEAASQDVKAVLVGDAADETHFGYPFLMNETSTRSPKNIIEYFGAVRLNPKFMTDAVPHFDSYYRKYATDRGHSWDRADQSKMATGCLVVDLWLRRLLYNGDRHTMQHSLEARVPFSSRAVMDLASRVPFRVATRDGIEKWHLRTMAEKRLSRALAWRPKSALTKSLQGRTTVFSELRSMWREAGDLISPFVDADFVGELIAKERPTDRDTSMAFRLLGTLTWMRVFL